MSRGSNSGRMFKVKDGPHAGKIAMAFHKEQIAEIVALKKIVIWVTVETEILDLFDTTKKQESKKFICSPDRLQLIGYFD